MAPSRFIGDNVRGMSTIKSGRLRGFTTGNTDLVGGRQGARNMFESLTGGAPQGGFARQVLADGREIVFRASSRTGSTISKIEIIDPLTKTLEKITFR
jgi:hypothetical protein